MHRPAFLLTLIFCLTPFICTSWGFHAHRTINEMAVYLLSPQAFSFYRPHLPTLIERATLADQRRYAVAGEAERHFLDVDHYERAFPIDSIRMAWDSACRRYGEDSLRSHGILPWSLHWSFWSLRNAIRNRDTALAIRCAADLGHYLADAHVPLHTTHNYNGQFTGQHGIHALWESSLPQRHAQHYRLWNPAAKSTPDLDSLFWTIVEESHAAVDSVLALEKLTAAQTGAKYGFEDKTRQVQRTYASEYCDHYHRLLAGMVERRMSLAVQRLALLWETALLLADLPRSGVPEEGTVDSLDNERFKARNQLH